MLTLRTTFLLLLLIALKLNSQTYITASDVTGTWDVSGSPYMIEGDITVTSGERLYIEPGVEIRMTGNFAIVIEGRLDANGTMDQNILFTLDDTTGFASGVNPGWSGMVFIDGSDLTENSIMNHCVIEYSALNGLTCFNYRYLEINHGIFRNNRNYGMALHEFSDITANMVDISNNQGGGVEVNFSAPYFSDFIISNNDGSGLYITGGSTNSSGAFFQNGQIVNNHSDLYGGGVHLSFDFNVSFQNIEISNNSSVNGGAIFMGNGLLNIDNSNIHSNWGTLGGAVYCDFGAHLIMDHNLISDNNAQQLGGGFYVSESSIDITNSTVTNNMAGNSAGSFYTDVYFSNSGSISNSIIQGNFPEDPIFNMISPEISYSNIYGGFEGEGNINSDPQFVDPENQNYQLSWEDFPYESGMKSPCIDAGDPHSSFDPDGTVADMGALYYHQSAITQVDYNPVVKKDISVYPNPASSFINVQGMEKIKVMNILNLSGQIVKQVEGTMLNGRIDISDLNSGIYLVSFISDNGSITTEKMIKE